MTADQIIALVYTTPKLEALRKAAKKGDQDALRDYVYFCAWQGILRDGFIPSEKKRIVFRKLVSADLIEVRLG